MPCRYVHIVEILRFALSPALWGGFGPYLWLIRIAKKRVCVDAALKIERGAIIFFDRSCASKQVIQNRANIKGYGRLEQSLPTQKSSRRTL